jgi:putative membrane protein
LQKASNADVKQFAQHMVDDHSKANESLIALAQRKNIKLSSEMGEEHQKTYKRLEKLSGAKFDKAYMKDMVQDHEKDVKEFEEASNDKSKADDIRAWAREQLPVLRNHLQMAKDIEKRLGK